MKSFIKKSILFLSLTLLFSYLAYLGLNKFQLQYYGKTLKPRWAMELRDQHTDYLFLGSSRIANMIAVQQADSTLHSSSINLATSGSSYGESFALFQQFLAHGNTTKTLILSFDLFRSKHNRIKDEVLTPLTFKHFDFFPYYSIPEIKSVYADHSSAVQMHLWQYVPFSRFAEFNNYFSVDSMYNYVVHAHQKTTAFNTDNGEQLIYKFDFKGEKYAVPGAVLLGPRGERYLLKILELAKNNNINIILVTGPYYSMKKFDRSYHSRYLQFLKDTYNITYWDFTAPKVWNESNYFFDAIHTNATGSRLYTKMLCDSIQTKLHIEK